MQTFRLKGRGMPILKQKGKFGDLLVKAKGEIPRNLSDEQKSILREMRKKEKKYKTENYSHYVSALLCIDVGCLYYDAGNAKSTSAKQHSDRAN
jgi:DnaJ-class molecular chaperone